MLGRHQERCQDPHAQVPGRRCGSELAKIRTGRAHPSLLEHVHVEYYGSEVPVSQAASVTVEDARTLAVTAWDKTMVGVIEKAILTSDLGLNPTRPQATSSESLCLH